MKTFCVEEIRIWEDEPLAISEEMRKFVLHSCTEVTSGQERV